MITLMAGDIQALREFARRWHPPAPVSTTPTQAIQWLESAWSMVPPALPNTDLDSLLAFVRRLHAIKRK